VVFVLIPLLAVVAGLCGDALVERSGAAIEAARPELAAAKLGPAIAGIVIVALVAVPARRGAQVVVGLRTPDTRARARDFLVAVSEPETKILHMPRDVYLAPTISGRENIRLDPRMGPGRALARRPDYVVFVDGYFQRFANNPIRAEKIRRREQRWRRVLGRRYVIARVFEGPPLPCTSCPGTTIGAYHQPKVTVYVRTER